jgi:hypothetical protein
MFTLSIRTLVCNAAAVFSGRYGAVTRQAEQAGCSRQTVYEHARRVQRRLPSADPTPPPAAAPVSQATSVAPAAHLDEPTRRRLAVAAFAMGISTRQIEDLFRVILPDDAPDHSTIGRWVAHEAEKAKPLLQVLDAAAASQIQALALDEIFFGGGRLWSASNPGA